MWSRDGELQSGKVMMSTGSLLYGTMCLKPSTHHNFTVRKILTQSGNGHCWPSPPLECLTTTFCDVIAEFEPGRNRKPAPCGSFELHIYHSWYLCVQSIQYKSLGAPGAGPWINPLWVQWSQWCPSGNRAGISWDGTKLDNYESWVQLSLKINNWSFCMPRNLA